MWAPVASILLLLLTAVAVGLIVRRWSRAGRPLRRMYSLVWTTLVVLGWVIGITTFATIVHAPAPVQRSLVLAYAACLLVAPVALALGVLRARLGRGRVADLVLRLEHAADPAELRTALAGALEDPDLDLLFPLGDGFARVDGTPAPLPGAGRPRTP